MYLLKIPVVIKKDKLKSLQNAMKWPLIYFKGITELLL